MQLRTVAHHVETVCCPTCPRLNQGQFPPEAADPLPYGPRLGAFIVYLRTHHLLPSARPRELLADLFGVAPSEGTLDRILGRAAATPASVVAQIRAAVTTAAVAHFDETGCYVEDARYWLHVACTAKLTYCCVHAKRGQAGMTARVGYACHAVLAS